MLVYGDTQPIEKIKIYDKGVTVTESNDFDQSYLNYRTGNITSPSVDNVEPLRTGINHFLECVELRKTPFTDGEDAMRVARALEYAEKSLRNGGRLLKRC